MSFQDTQNYFTEYTKLGKYASSFKIKKHLHHEKSRWQTIDVFDTESVGKLLVLDGKTMVSDLDEFIYHESLAHIPYAISRDTQKVLIIGGGDGGMVREFVKYPSIKQIDLVEIDERVIEVSKEYFPQCTVGLTDPRVRILPMDGIKFIQEQKNTYDIIIIDSTDPEDFASGLFTTDFYAHVSGALTAAGIMVAQTGALLLSEYDLKQIYSNLKASFPVVESFYAPLMIYPSVQWTFAFASKVYGASDFYAPKLEEVQKVAQTCQWYNMDWHRGAFALSQLQRKKLGLI